MTTGAGRPQQQRCLPLTTPPRAGRPVDSVAASQGARRPQTGSAGRRLLWPHGDRRRRSRVFVTLVTVTMEPAAELWFPMSSASCSTVKCDLPL
jgi:hypothetical protein